MNEGEIRQLALLQALMTERDAINGEIEGMIAENQQRALENNSMAYGDDAFNVCAKQLRNIAIRMRNEI